MKYLIPILLLIPLSAYAKNTPDPAPSQQQQQQQQDTKQSNSQNLVSENEVFAPVTTEVKNGSTAKVGDILEQGYIGGGKGEGHASTGPIANTNTAKIAPYKSFNTSINHEAPDLSKRVPDIDMAALVASGCIGSKSRGLSLSGGAIGYGNTVEHKRCMYLLMSAAVRSFQTLEHQALAFEVLCGDEAVLDADIRMKNGLCQQNKTAEPNDTIPASSGHEKQAAKIENPRYELQVVSSR